MLKSLERFPALTFHQPSPLMQTLSVPFSLFFFQIPNLLLFSSHFRSWNSEFQIIYLYRSSIYIVKTNIYNSRTSPLQVNTRNEYDFNMCFITPFLLEFALAI